jgi:hypothetical protein
LPLLHARVDGIDDADDLVAGNADIESRGRGRPW